MYISKKTLEYTKKFDYVFDIDTNKNIPLNFMDHVIVFSDTLKYNDRTKVWNKAILMQTTSFYRITFSILASKDEVLSKFKQKLYYYYDDKVYEEIDRLYEKKSFADRLDSKLEKKEINNKRVKI